jgi:hypothetical protein
MGQLRLQSFATGNQQRVMLAMLVVIFALCTWEAIGRSGGSMIWLSAAVGVNLPVALANVVAGRSFINFELISALAALFILFIGWWQTSEIVLLIGAVMFVCLLGLWLRRCAMDSSSGET